MAYFVKQRNICCMTLLFESVVACYNIAVKCAIHYELSKTVLDFSTKYYEIVVKAITVGFLWFEYEIHDVPAYKKYKGIN